jgi:DsbC/DsbD-like thiol-disulfide interchange protein
MRLQLCRHFLVGLALFVVSDATAGTLPAQRPTIADKVKITAAGTKPDASGKQVITVTLNIEKGWVIYANPVGNGDYKLEECKVTVTSKAKLAGVKISYPPSKVVQNRLVGNYNIWENKVIVTAIVTRDQDDTGPLTVAVSLHGFTDVLGLLPAEVTLTVP